MSSHNEEKRDYICGLYNRITMNETTQFRQIDLVRISSTVGLMQQPNVWQMQISLSLDDN